LLCFVPFDSLTRDEILRGHETYEAAFEDALAEGWVCELGRRFLENLEIYWDMKFAAQERTKERDARMHEEVDENEELAARGLEGAKNKSAGANGDDDDDDGDFDSDLDSDEDDEFVGVDIAEATRLVKARKELGPPTWVETTRSGFFDPRDTSQLPVINSGAGVCGKAIAEGMQRKPVGLVEAASHDDGSGSETEGDGDKEAAESFYESDGDDVEGLTCTPNTGQGDDKKKQHSRPLTDEELFANHEASCKDCKWGARPISFDRRIPVGIASTVLVTVRSGQPQQELPTCATINEISRLFGYTEDQHRAFVIIARAFISYLANEDAYFTMPDEEIAMFQRLLLIHGMGGTGKSHIIKGVIATAISWSRPSAVGIFAITGVAAINICGETFARLTYAFKRYGMSDKIRSAWAQMRVAILDEFSMVKDLDLYELDRFCRALTGRANLPFGGMIIVLAGDFCQLKPVGGSFLFQIPGSADNKRAAGYELYRAITSDAVVVLSKVPGSDLILLLRAQRSVAGRVPLLHPLAPKKSSLTWTMSSSHQILNQLKNSSNSRSGWPRGSMSKPAEKCESTRLRRTLCVIGSIK